MDHHHGAGRGDGGAVEVKLTADLRKRGHVWVQVRLTEEVEGEDRLRDKFFPQVHGGVAVAAEGNGDEMIIPRSYRSLCGVSTVDLWRCQLEVGCLHIEVVNKCCGALVV